MSAHAEAHAHHTNYVKVWAILVGLLAISVVGPMLGIRVVTLIAAFGVALVKAYMVAKNFMHLNVQKRIVHWVLGAALLIMVLLYAGISPDVGRDSGQNWKKDAGWHHLPAQHQEHSEHPGTAEKEAPHSEPGH